MKDKYEGTACSGCAGCHLQRDPHFRGKHRCNDRTKLQPQIWCADESVALFRRTGKILPA